MAKAVKMTKMATILLIILGTLIVFGVILYIFLQQNTVGADMVMLNTKSIDATYHLQSSDPATTDLTANPAITPQYNRSTSSRTLVATYDSNVYNQIKLADVQVASISPTDGKTETPITGLRLQFSNSNGITKNMVIVTVPSLAPSTIYHWTIKPSGKTFTDKVDVKFLTAMATGATAPKVSSVAQKTNATISAIQDKAGLCLIDLYQGTEYRLTLNAELSYTGCSADTYVKKTGQISFDRQTGALGLNPTIKVQQAFGKMIEIDSRDGIYNTDPTNPYSVKATAKNSKGSSYLTANIKHLDPIGLYSITQVGPNSYSILSDPIYVDNSPLVGAAISVKASDSAAGPVTTSYTTDANGCVTILYNADPNKTEIVDFTASYKPTGSTITFPLINSRFLLMNY